MRRTGTPTVLLLAVGGAAVAFLLEVLVVNAGRAAIVPPISLAVTLVGVGAVVVALAWPIRRAVKGTGPRHVDPFRAMRVAVLAKACSLSGALLLGFGAGVLLYLVTRTVLPGGGATWLSLASLLAAGALLAAGLVAEHFCTLPPDDDEQQEEAHV
ncbi:DUF3180 domain-containing protein [Agromyces sp. SYSU T00194]|uniref:DUF3180 domain-containing protein n=1 Tax=Agromyces chitinivorans TaxID=3158560 RepID=UPI003395AC0D